MKRYLVLSLALVAVLGFAVAQVLARGGGHGGGHHGGHHGTHHGGHHGHHAGHHANHRHTDHHYHHSHWAHHNRPFSHGWYARHGGRWGYGWGGWGSPWVPAAFGAAATWLGIEAAAPIVGNYGTPIVDDDSTDANNSQTNQPPAADSDDDNVEAPQYPDAQKTAAVELAKSGADDPAKDAQFMPLGVFTLAPRDSVEASAILQLGVAKDGALRGTYYDLLSDQDHPIRGAIDKKTQRAAFTFGPSGKVLFETSLANLTQPTGGVAVHYENGESRHWTLARYAKEPTEDDEDGDDDEEDEKPQKASPVKGEQAPNRKTAK